jgi:hypothetical protein
VLRRFAQAVRLGRTEEIRGYAAAIDPRALAEVLSTPRANVWSLFEVARNVLVFVPIAVTWYGLSVASLAYAALLEQRPEFITRPFLLLWQEGFDGAAGVINFSTVAQIDAALIGVLIALSLAMHLRSELREPAARAHALLKESEIRGLLGEATSVASSDISLQSSEGVLDEMIAEEHRIYERAMEREQQLFDLEGSVRQLSEAVAEFRTLVRSLARPESGFEHAAETRRDHGSDAT